MIVVAGAIWDHFLPTLQNSDSRWSALGPSPQRLASLTTCLDQTGLKIASELRSKPAANFG